jgi:hypothetical protein
LDISSRQIGEDDEDEDKSRFPDSDYNLLQLIDDQREENQVLQDENTELKRQQSLMLSRHEEDTIKNDDIRNKLEAEVANLKNKLEEKDLGYANLESELTLVRSVEVPRHLSEIVRLRFQNCEMTKAHQELTQEVEALKIEKEEVKPVLVYRFYRQQHAISFFNPSYKVDKLN